MWPDGHQLAIEPAAALHSLDTALDEKPCLFLLHRIEAVVDLQPALTVRFALLASRFARFVHLGGDGAQVGVRLTEHAQCRCTLAAHLRAHCVHALAREPAGLLPECFLLRVEFEFVMQARQLAQYVSCAQLEDTARRTAIGRRGEQRAAGAEAEQQSKQRVAQWDFPVHQTTPSFG